MVVETFDGNGNLLTRTVGDTSRVRWQKHLRNKCDAFCTFCYDEGMKYLDNLEKTENEHI